MRRLIMIFIIVPILVSYAQYLKDEQIKAQRYVDRLNDTRNHRYSEELDASRFRRDWFEYEDEYLDNWDRS